MTIFLMVLKKLIKEQLNAASSTLESQAQYPSLYNQLLSLQKKNIVDTLESKVVAFLGTGDDEADSKSINKLIEEARILIQGKQEEHGKSRDSGETLEMMSNLIFHTNAFYTKLDKYNKSETSDVIDKGEGPVKLRLINHPYHNTPENTIYFFAAGYIGEEIFKPSSKIDLVVRNRKEEAVLSRIQSLSEVIKPQFGLGDRKTRAMKTLSDLAMDNMTIITPTTTSSFGLPFVSLGGFFSVKVPTTLFNPSEGRFGKLFSLAESLVKDMTELEFQPAEVSTSVGHAM